MPGDISSITYDPFTNTILAATVGLTYIGLPFSSQLYSVNPDNGDADLIATIYVPYIDSISLDPLDDEFYAYALNSSSPWDLSSFASIDQSSGALTTLFDTPYRTVLGLALDFTSGDYWTWVNSTAHYYGFVDPTLGTVTLEASSDLVGVASDAMISLDLNLSKPVQPIPDGGLTLLLLAAAFTLIAAFLIGSRKRLL